MIADPAVTGKELKIVVMTTSAATSIDKASAMTSAAAYMVDFHLKPCHNHDDLFVFKPIAFSNLSMFSKNVAIRMTYFILEGLIWSKNINYK